MSDLGGRGPITLDVVCGMSKCCGELKLRYPWKASDDNIVSTYISNCLNNAYVHLFQTQCFYLY